MPRCGRIRRIIQKNNYFIKLKRLSFFLPYLILIFELIVLIEASIIDFNPFLIIITFFLVIISSIEIIFVTREIHSKIKDSNFNKILTIKLDDFIIQKKAKNVRNIIDEFLEQYPEYANYRNEIYHTTCRILQTHKEEYLDKELTDKLKIFIKQKKQKNVNELVKIFINKYPNYKKLREQIYKKICMIKGVNYEDLK